MKRFVSLEICIYVSEHWGFLKLEGLLSGKVNDCGCHTRSYAPPVS